VRGRPCSFGGRSPSRFAFLRRLAELEADCFLTAPPLGAPSGAARLPEWNSFGARFTDAAPLFPNQLPTLGAGPRRTPPQGRRGEAGLLIKPLGVNAVPRVRPLGSWNSLSSDSRLPPSQATARPSIPLSGSSGSLLLPDQPRDAATKRRHFGHRIRSTGPPWASGFAYRR
jgi:hypothetical protein